MSDVIDYWLDGQIDGASLTWEYLIKVLRTSHVGEKGLANRISEKYCKAGPMGGESSVKLCSEACVIIPSKTL